MSNINYFFIYIITNNFFRSDRHARFEQTPNNWRYKNLPMPMRNLKYKCMCTTCSKCKFITSDPQKRNLCSVRYMINPLRKDW